MVEGSVLLHEAVVAGWEIECQFVAPGGRAVDAGGDVFGLANGVIEKVASTQTPQSVIGIVRRRVFGGQLVDEADFVVVADGVSDPGNLGTMMRSAAGSGADVLAVTPRTVDPTSPKVVRSSAGSIFRLPVVEVPDIARLGSAGLVTIGTTSHQGNPYTAVDFSRRIALVLGSEPHGLEADSRVDEWATIPLEKEVESLNVAMACTVLCFEVSRQRRAGSGTLEKP